jgi:hypothetical protein
MEILSISLVIVMKAKLRVAQTWGKQEKPMKRKKNLIKKRN